MPANTRISVYTFSVLGFLIALGSLRFIGRGDLSLWFDELFSVFWAKAGPSFMFAHISDETNPPLYYLFLSGWIALFGDTETVVRLPSAIASAVTIPLLYLLGRNLFNERAGIIAAFLYGLSYWQIVFAYDARAYAILNLLFVLMLLCLHYLIIELQRDKTAIRATLSLPGFVLVLAAVSAAYLHYIAFCIFLSIFIALTGIWWRQFAFCRRFAACFTLIGGAVAVLTLPSFAIALLEPHPTNLGLPGIPSIENAVRIGLGVPRWGFPSDNQSQDLYDTMSLAYKIASVVSGAAWLVLLSYGALSYKKRPAFSLTFVLAPIGFSVLVLASIYRPVFLEPRTALWLSVPVYLGVGAGTSVLKSVKLRRGAIVLLLIFGIFFTVGYWILPQKEPWRVWVADIASRTSEGDLVILGHDTPATAFIYYGEPGVLPLLRRWRANSTAGDKLDAYLTGIQPAKKEEIAAARMHGRKIVFVTRQCRFPKWVEPKDIFYPPCQAPVDSGQLVRYLDSIMKISYGKMRLK